MNFPRAAVSALVLSLFLVANVHGEPGACRISVRTTMKSGKVKKRVFNSKAGTAADCAEDASLHTTNFFPPKIAKKEVEYRFGDGPAIKAKGDGK